VTDRVDDHGLGSSVEPVKDPVDADAKRAQVRELAAQRLAAQRLFFERKDRRVDRRRVVRGEPTKLKSGLTG